jgi:hypothetical protein
MQKTAKRKEESTKAVYIEESTAIIQAGTILSLDNWTFDEIQQFGREAQYEANNEAKNEAEAFEVLCNYLNGFKCHGDTDDYDTCSKCGVEVDNPNFEDGFECEDCFPWDVEVECLDVDIKDFASIGYMITDMLDVETETCRINYDKEKIKVEKLPLHIPVPSNPESVMLKKVTCIMKDSSSLGYQLVKVYINGKEVVEVGS